MDSKKFLQQLGKDFCNLPKILKCELVIPLVNKQGGIKEDIENCVLIIKFEVSNNE